MHDPCGTLTLSARSRPKCQATASHDGSRDTFWVIAAHGWPADWVRNISKEAKVRVLVNRRWRRGTASLMPEDDSEQRSRTLPFRWDAATGRTIATTPLTVRIDLEPEASP